MADPNDVRRIALSLPGTTEGRDRFAFSVGFPAVLVRLPKVTRAQLHKLIVDAWRCQAPRHLVQDLARAPARPGPPRRRR